MDTLENQKLLESNLRTTRDLVKELSYQVEMLLPLRSTFTESTILLLRSLRVDLLLLVRQIESIDGV